jgi:putative oxidoreductase
MQRFEPYARSVLRCVTGLLFLCHGLQKLIGAFGGIDGKGAGIPPGTLPWFGGVLELIGGPLILLGLFTRPAAFLLCGEMAVAYFHVHAPHGFAPIRNGGELAALYCFVFLYLFTAGPGPISLDRFLRGFRKSSGGRGA